ncbi:TPA: UDP-galactopyranose mutase [Citrobacter braakii]|jgi:UDP-galactopyranose mutase
MAVKYDYVIIGCGLSGIVLANNIATKLNKKVLIIEKRDHIGGNCYDYYDEHGVLVHKYGPHIFHTNYKDVFDYLDQYTEWFVYQFQARTLIDGKKTYLPFNLNTMKDILDENLYGEISQKLIETYGYDKTVPIFELKKSKDKKIQWLADYIYDKVYVNYIAKQWNLKPEELDKSVLERVPVYISRDNRYFKDKYQIMPRDGYTVMFNKMLANKNIHVLLNANADDFITLTDDNQIKYMGGRFDGKLIYTGQIDHLFGYKYGELPYRSLRFDFVNYTKEFFQEVAMVSYPNNYDFTRITESKHLTGQDCKTTTVVYEYPQDYDKNDPDKNVPYYPVPRDENHQLYSKYSELASNYKSLILVGRLAQYKYYNMDQMIKVALDTFVEIQAGEK